jgi:hypothetical protein
LTYRAYNLKIILVIHSIQFRISEHQRTRMWISDDQSIRRCQKAKLRRKGRVRGRTNEK